MRERRSLLHSKRPPFVVACSAAKLRGQMQPLRRRPSKVINMRTQIEKSLYLALSLSRSLSLRLSLSLSLFFFHSAEGMQKPTPLCLSLSLSFARAMAKRNFPSAAHCAPPTVAGGKKLHAHHRPRLSFLESLSLSLFHQACGLSLALNISRQPALANPSLQI